MADITIYEFIDDIPIEHIGLPEDFMACQNKAEKDV